MTRNEQILEHLLSNRTFVSTSHDPFTVDAIKAAMTGLNPPITDAELEWISGELNTELALIDIEENLEHQSAINEAVNTMIESGEIRIEGDQMIYTPKPKKKKKRK